MTARKVLDKAMTEAELQRVVIEYAHLRGWLVHHDRGDYRQTIQGDPGFPDLVLARAGVVVFVELKAEGKKPTDAQYGWLGTLEARGEQNVYVWWPANWSSGLIQKVLA